jgi:hypothetical protein
MQTTLRSGLRRGVVKIQPSLGGQFCSGADIREPRELKQPLEYQVIAFHDILAVDDEAAQAEALTRASAASYEDAQAVLDDMVGSERLYNVTVNIPVRLGAEIQYARAIFTNVR